MHAWPDVEILIFFFLTTSNVTAACMQELYEAIVNVLAMHPEFATKPFFIAGESYAGHYIPWLARRILAANANPAEVSGSRFVPLSVACMHACHSTNPTQNTTLGMADVAQSARTGGGRSAGGLSGSADGQAVLCPRSRPHHPRPALSGLHR